MDKISDDATSDSRSHSSETSEVHLRLNPRKLLFLKQMCMNLAKGMLPEEIVQTRVRPLQSRLDELLTGSDDLGAQVDYVHTSSERITSQIVPTLSERAETLERIYKDLDTAASYARRVNAFLRSLEELVDEVGNASGFRPAMQRAKLTKAIEGLHELPIPSIHDLAVLEEDGLDGEGEVEVEVEVERGMDLQENGEEEGKEQQEFDDIVM
eukprot:TRINITY_DN115_c0_g1_i1.p1 TRINITY_DN115_c0_g1~~TRINITY_DN115_c0_g1_i1.p1  ORF type:complete len:211 (-),score=69.16 TRINITY_DN115_c0_g1_i1:20-652(-)